MYEKELNKLKNVLNIFDEDLNNKAEDVKIKRLFENIKDVYNFDLSNEYYQFLKECNGFEFNGYTIYGTDDFIKNNKDYEQICYNEYIIIGEYDISFYVINIKDNSLWELDKPSGDRIQEFNSLEEMIKYIILESIK